MSSGTSLQKLSQATLGSTFERQLHECSIRYGKNRKMPVHLSVLRPDWKRADDGSTLVMTQCSRPVDACYVSAVLWMAQK